jgi:hypothetical protein
MLAVYLAATVLAADLRDRARARLAGQAGFTTVEWVVIGSIVFAMAIMVGAALKAVADNYLGKIN